MLATLHRVEDICRARALRPFQDPAGRAEATELARRPGLDDGRGPGSSGRRAIGRSLRALPKRLARRCVDQLANPGCRPGVTGVDPERPFSGVGGPPGRYLEVGIAAHKGGRPPIRERLLPQESPAIELSLVVLHDGRLVALVRPIRWFLVAMSACSISDRAGKEWKKLPGRP